MAYQTISNRATNVALALGNRTDANFQSRVYGWLNDSYTEFAWGYPFEELESTIDMVTSAPGPYDYDPTMRAVKTIALNLNATGNPANDSWRRLWRRNIRNIDRYSRGRSSPAVYCSFAKQIHIRPVPDKPYPMKWRVWLKPPAPEDGNVQDTELMVPDDWLEIVDYGAKMRGFADLLERDKAREIYILLYGDPNRKDAPGLIKQKMLLKQAEAEDDNYSIQPRVRRYSNTI